MSLKLGNGKEWEQLGSGNLRENRGNGESFCEIAAVITGTETALMVWLWCYRAVTGILYIR